MTYGVAIPRNSSLITFAFLAFANDRHTSPRDTV